VQVMKCHHHETSDTPENVYFVETILGHGRCRRGRTS
jgi:hypothetical protein